MGIERHLTTSRLARLARTVLRPTAGSLNATVISSSLRVSFDITTMPSPQRAWRAAARARYWRSPGTVGRGGTAEGDVPADGASGTSVPDRAPAAKASRF